MKKERGIGVLALIVPLVLMAVAAYVMSPEITKLMTDAKDAGTKGSLGGLRTALSLSVAAISLREDPAMGATPFPTVQELNANEYMAEGPAFHRKMNGHAIMNRAGEIPKNPWTDSRTVHDCTGKQKGTVLVGAKANDGWCYDSAKGIIWANSSLSTGKIKENEF